MKTLKTIEPNVGTLGATCRRLFNKCGLSTDDHWLAQRCLTWAVNDRIEANHFKFTNWAMQVTL